MVRYLDLQSVMKLRMVIKEIITGSDQAMYHVWHYLVVLKFLFNSKTRKQLHNRNNKKLTVNALKELLSTQQKQQ